MKEYKYLYRKMLDEEIIRKAYKNLRKGKTKRKEIQYIDAHLDEEVQYMHDMIENTRPPGEAVPHPELAFRPPKRTAKKIVERNKVRKIYMPEIHEQWLHHIIVLILAPIIQATAYPYSCGSLPKRGGHYGKRQIERWLRRNASGTRNFAKVDIRHFYDSIRIGILMAELGIRIKDRWFLYIIWLCLKGFKKGIPLGFYISQWLANYILEPVDKFITEVLGIKEYMRYMDDMTMFHANKKLLHRAIVEIMKILGRRFRLKLKSTWQVCKFAYEKKPRRGSAAAAVVGRARKRRTIGRPLDFMGFVFFRDRTVIRKHIMLKATRLAARLQKAKVAGRTFYKRHVSAMLSYMGWFSCTDAYGCYEQRIKPYVRIKSLKQIISKLQRRENHDKLEKRAVLQPAC